MNLDGWAGEGMTVELYRHKASILEQHCEDVGRDPAEIRRTLLVPTFLTEDRDFMDKAVKALGPGTFAGPSQYLVDRIGEFQNAGIDELIFGGILCEETEKLQSLDEEVIGAFR